MMGKIKIKNNIKLLLILLILLLPQACAVIWQLDSIIIPFIIIGVNIAAYFFIFTKNKWIKTIFKFKLMIICMVVIIIHTFLVLILSELISIKIDIFRLTLSWIALPLILSYSAILVLLNSNEKFLTEKINQVINIFILGGLMGVMGFTFFGPYYERKPIMTFSEISHYAVFITPFLWYLLVSNEVHRNRKILVILTFTVIALLYQSLTLVLIILIGLVLFLYLEIKKNAFIITNSILILLFLILLGVGDNSGYYISRLSTSVNEDSTNLSYLSGIEEAYIALDKTYGLGLGFQQMGIEEPSGTIANFHYEIKGAYINRFDGGAVFIKLIAEFGLIGIITVLLILKIITNSFYNLIKTKKINFNSSASPSYIFANCLLCSFVLYLFVRGGGYHSIQFAYLIAGLFTVTKINRKKLPFES